MKLTFWLSSIFFFFLFAIIPNRLIQIALLLLLIWPLLNGIYFLLVRKAVKITRKDTLLRGHRGSVFTISITLQNRSFLPIFRALITDNTGQLFCKFGNRQVVFLAARSQHSFSYTLSSRERGVFTIGPAKLTTYDLFGFFSHTQRSHEQCSVIVYPHIKALKWNPSHGFPQGRIHSKSKLYEDPGRYRSLRPYQYGDPQKLINWKASAKAREFMVNEFEKNLYTPLCILLNFSSTDYPHKNRYSLSEEALEAASSLLVAAGTSASQVVLLSSGTVLEECIPLKLKSPAIYSTAILEQLAKIRLTDSSPLSMFSGGLSVIPWRATVYCISPFNSDFFNYVHMACSRSNAHLHIVLPFSSKNEVQACKKLTSQVYDTGDLLYEF